MISKVFFFSLFLLRKSSWYLLVFQWLNYRPSPHLSLSPASMSIILAVVHVQNFAIPYRRKLSTLISWVLLMKEWRHSGMHCCLCQEWSMSVDSELYQGKNYHQQDTDCTISASKTGYSERSLRTARYHIHHFILNFSQNFWESWRVDVTFQECQILVKALT